MSEAIDQKADVDEVVDNASGSQKNDRQQTAYPSESIMPSISLVKQIVSAKGEINPISRKDISVITDKAEATLSMKLSTCVQYGLLKSQFGKGYLPGELYHKYTYEEQANSLLLIFSSPPLYKKLIEDLNGKILPNEKDFAAHLKNNYNLNPNSSFKAANVFLENARNLNLIDSNNRLKFIIKENPSRENPDKGNGDIPAEKNGQSSHVAPPVSTGLFKLPIQLPGDDDRVAYFEYPKTLNKRDFKVIAKALTFIASTLIMNEDDEDYELKIEVKEINGEDMKKGT
jgi:hypothetical protein